MTEIQTAIICDGPVKTDSKGFRYTERVMPLTDNAKSFVDFLTKGAEGISNLSEALRDMNTALIDGHLTYRIGDVGPK